MVPPCSRTHLIGSRQCRRTADLVELQAVEPKPTGKNSASFDAPRRVRLVADSRPF
jgi:hypothetical protein